ncbi:UDP-N-acetylglucosamine-N-acetylmuramylpentapeptide N-acetylglucosamine transferase [Friedmanniella luteola]|uniref:UDP-N-acetylglucosamine--N-acetylmuramyl-(pentapeptide) pyrophosphoryl-undecaprenol N-acetylglucosamine transferase n=1 Tax=Friedmanniella luteola TaxID=546871 RepID=A0A1H1PD73_9ACTN|nr:undecaprenyldiphospho-muramoylpentapeptide beta-N-acetylglucosaminyltransferase [Friedmanniella luteola]SDS09050.1 UDP-N-acetylglucosamine-N-acetylmuramylpentapeptide N-acetylglucosamine transferase [Friedmanniella luteola]
MTSAAPSVVLAGGGTSGHTSPLIATAAELERLRPGVRVTAVGTARGLETRVVPAAGLTLELIPPVPLPRRPGVDQALVGVRLWQAVAAAVTLLRRVEADVVLGFGGYVSTPVYLAARRLGLPIVLHEQNAVPGLANKLAARLTRHVYTAFPDTPLPHARYLGLPLRRGITELDRAAARSDARSRAGLDPERTTLLVSGGSQGAASINRAVLGARDSLLAAGIQVLHVLGPKNLTDETRPTVDLATGAGYHPVGYVDAMEDAYAAADLMLGRCGASTVLETAVVGLPAVFVPYPHGNGEQARNAALVVDAGGGLLLPDAACTATWVARTVPALLADAARLRGMTDALRGVARVDAASQLARRTLEVVA